MHAKRTGTHLKWTIFFLIALGFAIHGLHAPAKAAGRCAVLPFNNLGMHCMDSEFSQLSILPPFNVLKRMTREGSIPTR
ncbi:MAG: hypothetical protein ABSG91_09425 [Syntrophobacteraceae bacterium]